MRTCFFMYVEKLLHTRYYTDMSVHAIFIALICVSQLKYQMKKYWLNANVLYEQLLSSVPYASTLSHMQQYIYVLCILNNPWIWSKLTFFFKFKNFQPLKLFLEIWFISQLGLKSRHICQLRTGVQFYKAVDMATVHQGLELNPQTFIKRQTSKLESVVSVVVSMSAS